eukprot:CAMPEP_0178477750 /NCGR_PEP_ID=MMETSP0696-20121128/4294_1 /TAXON_ID=265572 /ORGANISM="Extubocellulus spinifer, Strain CCMP396" /LENGTH=446 /DNA_ID=CAMNT_0020105075 /DNA_START=205 /DNA_END=1545 /DNA_ORIENTATION=+
MADTSNNGAMSTKNGTASTVGTSVLGATSAISSGIGSGLSTVSKLVVGPDELTHAQLQSIEKRRRAILLRSELPFYKMLFFWDGTCLKLLALDPLLWFTLIIYIVIRVRSRTGLPDYVEDLSSGNIGVIGAFLSFFLVFFVVNSNKRFDDQYGLSMAAKGRILDIASMARGTLPKERALRLIRYLNASHVVAYCGLSDTYTSRNLFQQIYEQTKFLTPLEYERVKECDMDAGGSCYRELVAWTQLEISDAVDEDLIDAQTAVMYRDKLLDFQGALSGLFNFADQPISFFYIHFISLLSALYLPLFAVSSAFEAGVGADVYWTSDLVNGLIVFLQSIFVIGLRVLGQKLSDPYGADVEDLSVMFYLNFTFTQSNRILSAEAPKRPTDEDPVEVEEKIVEDRVTIGAAWDGGEAKGGPAAGQEPILDEKGDVVDEVPTDSEKGYCAVQ